LVYVPFVAGLISLAVFVWHEYHTTAPMLPLGLFKVRNFSVGNVSTFAIYGGLSVAVFLIAVFVQQVAGYTALEAGLALLPVTIIMFFLSSPVGALAGRYGPRFFMGVGPIIGGVSFLYLMRADATAAYVTQLLPAIVGFGVGLVLTVAPLTAAILGAVEPQRAGIASAVNNAVARIAGLITVAVLGMVTGSHLDAHAFHRGMVFAAALLIGGGVISAIGIQNNITSHTKQ
jgi:predicted MFS family arabinose efflux permease